MMERKKLLEEGYLEKYVLDELTNSERQQVEAALKADANLRKEYRQLEEDFERMAFENAIVPAPEVKERLLHNITTRANKKIPKTWLWAAASLAVLFFLSFFWMYNRWRTSEQNFDQLQEQTTLLQERLNALEENYLLTNQRLKTINGPQTIPLILHGNDLVPKARAVAYVNHDNKMVVVNAQGLPKLPKDKTYQMWSDVDGEMINMGLLPTSEELITLDYIEKAESLNITIEPAGGNDHPTVERLIANVTL